MEHVKINDYVWPTANLARNIEAGRRRGSLYWNDFLGNALNGRVPEIHQPIQAATPNSDGEVPYLLDGMGRIESVALWESQTPTERLKQALALFRASAGGKIGKLTDAELNMLTVDNLAGVADKLEIEPTQVERIQAAFRATILIPVLWVDANQESAQVAAVSALVTRDGATMADRLKIFQTLRPRYRKQQEIAALLQVSNPVVTYLKQYDEALSAGAIHPLLHHLMLVHSTPISGMDQFDARGRQVSGATAHKSEVTISGLLQRLKLGKDEARHAPKGVRVDYDDKEQTQALSTALDSAWAELVKTGKVGAEVPQPTFVQLLKGDHAHADTLLRATKAKDIYEALSAISIARAKALVNASEGESKGTESKPRDPKREPRERALRPSLEDVLRFVQVERWQGAKQEETIAAFRDFLFGNLGPKAAAVAIEESKRNSRSKKSIDSMDLPDNPGERVKSFGASTPAPAPVSEPTSEASTEV